ncbi:hypothetical protein AB9P05_10605 [Roseivirga sp. BDSF3-8]|uniref:hypothetical protein n=1 Tax=Roseivirga sp. BDSF3-8 TaxID=3241598 RepID=UPI0035320DE8
MRTLLLILLCCLPSISEACQCVNFPVDRRMNDKYTELIFVGKIIRTPSPEAYFSGKDEQVMFDVEKLYKGDASNDQVLLTLDFACTGSLPEAGAELLVFVHSSPDFQRITSGCDMFPLNPEDFLFKGLQKLSALEAQYPSIVPASSGNLEVMAFVFLGITSLFAGIILYSERR